MRSALALCIALLAPIAHAQVRPDPTDVGPPPTDEPKDPIWTFGLEARMPILRGEATAFSPRVGVGIGVHIERIVTPWFALRLAITYDRNYTLGAVPLPGVMGTNGDQITVERSQNLTTASFVPEALFRWSRGWFTLHAGIGIGAYVGFFTNATADETQRVDARNILFGGRAEAGVAFRLHKSFSLGLGFEYNLRRSTELVAPAIGGPKYRAFDDFMDVSLRIDYRF
jgi:hypothetical protein